jgi:hypothetical protein
MHRPGSHPRRETSRQPPALVVHIPLGEVAMNDQYGQLAGPESGQGIPCVPGGRRQPGTQPRADPHQPLDARIPVKFSVHGDAHMLRMPAGTLPETLCQTAKRYVQASQVSAPPTLLPRALLTDRPPRNVASRAVPPALVLNEISDRFRHDPPGIGEVPKHGMLVRNAGSGCPGVVTPQYDAPAISQLHQPAGIVQRDILQHGHRACLQAEHTQHTEHVGRAAGQHSAQRTPHVAVSAPAAARARRDPRLPRR